MKIEDFKNKCKDKTLRKSILENNLIERYNKLKEEQKEYGESYIPIYDYDYKHSYVCPNCKNKLNKYSVPDNGLNTSFIYRCECGYEFAI